MNQPDNFIFTVTGNPFIIFILIIILIGTSFFVYKYTIPKVSNTLRYILISIRTLIFVLILLLIFEPAYTIIHKEKMQSGIYLFVDNSNSLAVKDSSQRVKQIKNLVNSLSKINPENVKILLFGAKIDSLTPDNLSGINLSETRTNFSKIIEKMNSNNNHINSAVIVSDGIITDGADPSYEAEKLQVPLFTVAIGDSTQKNDISVYNIVSNQIIYAGKQTQIEVLIKNLGFGGKTSNVTLYEEGKIISTQNVILNELGLNRVYFNYKAVTGGEKKMNVFITPLEGEESKINNNKVFYLNILDTKLNVCIIAGSPSADVSAISTALGVDKDIQVKKLIQVSTDKFWNNVKPTVVDSADILFLIDFPSVNSPYNLIDKVFSSIEKLNKPYFIMISSGVDLTKLKTYEKLLPFSINTTNGGTIKVQSELISDNYLAYFSNSGNKKEIWNNLPPVTQFAAGFTSKPGSNVLLKSNVRNMNLNNPLIVTRNIGMQRIFSILAGDIWNWELQTAARYPEFYVNFINDIVKWLSASHKNKQFNITTDKKTYFQNEQVEFTAELYDHTFNPIDTANINLQISGKGHKTSLNFSPQGNGIYTLNYSSVETGDFSYEGTTGINGSYIKSNFDRFSIEEMQAEKLDTQMKPSFLKSLAKATNGMYYSIDDYSDLKDKLIKINNNHQKEYTTRSEFRIWENKLILIILICLFAIEWIIRKRAGMI
jgi:hypothetical protein